jgi:hypothetical protein
MSQVMLWRMGGGGRRDLLLQPGGVAVGMGVALQHASLAAVVSACLRLLWAEACTWRGSSQHPERLTGNNLPGEH